MSLVGTRPPTVDEWEQYELHHRSRMSTKPGIIEFKYYGNYNIKQHLKPIFIFFAYKQSACYFASKWGGWGLYEEMYF